MASDMLAREQSMPAPSSELRIRGEEEIREALRAMCDTVWNAGRGGGRRPFWHIPADPERDVDFILYDAFKELVAYRARFGPLVSSPANGQEKQSADRAE